MRFKESDGFNEKVSFVSGSFSYGYTMSIAFGSFVHVRVPITWDEKAC